MSDSGQFISEQAETDYELLDTAGQARRGTLTIRGVELKTPNLMPVINFYAGGTEASMYGGGIHRTMKEFMTGHETIGGENYDEYFDCAMSSVASLTDYNINHERYQDYIAAPIKQRESFKGFSGALFIDSGGFKFLDSNELDGSNFEVEIDQQKVYEIQQKMGADIVVNLDRPIAPDDSYETRVEKAEQTAENIAEFLDLSQGDDSARYLTLHGYNYAMLETFFNIVEEYVPLQTLRREFDGMALGSLVPLKDNKNKLISAVQDCRTILNDRGLEELPLHILGISSSSIPLLAAVGADTFDSSSYLHSAINGKYVTSLLGSEPLDHVDFSKCDCPVCTDPELVSRMRGNTEYQKDKLGPVAMHNLIIQKRGVAQVRECIAEEGTDGLIDYLESEIGTDKSMRPHAHRVVNESLGGYF